MTPEGKVKAKVKRILAKFASTTWVDMPVPSGFGKSTLDFIGCNLGRFFVIETKRDKKEPTRLQWAMIHKVIACGGRAFVICGDDSPVLRELEEWLG